MKHFSILSSNCWSIEAHKKLGIPYTTPFINLATYSEEFLECLHNAHTINFSNVREIEESEFDSLNEDDKGPIVRVDECFNLRAVHDPDFEHFNERWQRRVGRLRAPFLVHIPYIEAYRSIDELRFIVREFDGLVLTTVGDSMGELISIPEFKIHTVMNNRAYGNKVFLRGRSEFTKDGIAAIPPYEIN